MLPHNASIREAGLYLNIQYNTSSDLQPFWEKEVRANQTNCRFDSICESAQKQVFGYGQRKHDSHQGLECRGTGQKDVSKPATERKAAAGIRKE
jgi:hypothetical protein